MGLGCELQPYWGTRSRASPSVGGAGRALGYVHVGWNELGCIKSKARSPQREEWAGLEIH